MRVSQGSIIQSTSQSQPVHLHPIFTPIDRWQSSATGDFETGRYSHSNPRETHKYLKSYLSGIKLTVCVPLFLFDCDIIIGFVI